MIVSGIETICLSYAGHYISNVNYQHYYSYCLVLQNNLKFDNTLLTICIKLANIHLNLVIN